MKALILRTDVEACTTGAQALIEKGFQVLCVETRQAAQAMIKLDTIDLLIAEERVAGGLTHTLALSAERRNPYLSTIMLTDRPSEDTDELYSLIPSLYALMGTNTPAKLLSQLAISSIENFAEADARVSRYRMMDQAEEAQDAEWEELAAQQPRAPVDHFEFGDDPEDIEEQEAQIAQAFARTDSEQQGLQGAAHDDAAIMHPVDAGPIDDLAPATGLDAAQDPQNTDATEPAEALTAGADHATSDQPSAAVLDDDHDIADLPCQDVAEAALLLTNAIADDLPAEEEESDETATPDQIVALTATHSFTQVGPVMNTSLMQAGAL